MITGWQILQIGCISLLYLAFCFKLEKIEAKIS